ncbi:MAG: tRNA1(Val) (adenine(37)-N6)-methyltransferase [Firmicutes bacterium]|nr:tRNA1(Val) (adenine(37)-N6)-methyltransferase [Bacillota bacterium]
MNKLLLPGERLDDLGDGLRIIQRRDVFAFSSDAVLLANFVSLFRGERVIDLGTGTGVIPLLISKRRPLRQIVALEIQAQLVEMCRRSVAFNGLNTLIDVVHADLREVRDSIPPESFNVVTANPPYMPADTGSVNKNQAIAVARHELFCKLEDVIKAAAWLVMYGGKFAMVHRPQRLADICGLMLTHRLQPKRMQLIHPRAGREAEMVLIEAEKGARPGLRVLAPLFLNGSESV